MRAFKAQTSLHANTCILHAHCFLSSEARSLLPSLTFQPLRQGGRGGGLDTAEAPPPRQGVSSSQRDPRGWHSVGALYSLVNGVVSHLLNGLLFAGAILNAFQIPRDATLQSVNPFHHYQLFDLPRDLPLIDEKDCKSGKQGFAQLEKLGYKLIWFCLLIQCSVSFPQTSCIIRSSIQIVYSLSTFPEHVLRAVESWTSSAAYSVILFLLCATHFYLCDINSSSQLPHERGALACVADEKTELREVE